MASRSFALWMGLACIVSAAAGDGQEHGVKDSGLAAADGQEHGAKDSGLEAGWKVVLRVYDQCRAASDTLQCVKGRVVRFVDRALKMEAIALMDGVTLVRDVEAKEDARALKEEDVEDGDKVDGLLMERVGKFVETHSVQINVPKIVDTIFNEGRGNKLKKMKGPLMMMGLLWKAGMLALGFKAVAALAGKALMVANVALVLAAVIGLKKLLTPEKDQVTYEIIKSPKISHGYAHTVGMDNGGWEASGGYAGASAGGGSGGHNYRSLEAVAESKAEHQIMTYNSPQYVQRIVVPRPSSTADVLVGARSAV